MWLVFLLFLLNFGRTHGKDYTVIVETSDLWNAGTDANVKVQITGTLGTLGPRLLKNDRGIKAMERGDTDQFILEDYDRGYVKGIDIWRDNAGAAPGWHLKQVVVKVSGAADSVFSYNGWLPTDWTKLTLSCTEGNEVNQQGYCSDENTCSQSNPCKDPKATCENLGGTSRCSCPAGYELPNNAVSEMCQDIDECTQHTDQCEQNCHNNDGSYTCSCNQGYELNGLHACDDVDECSKNPSTCKAPSQCINTESSYECRCPSGYTKKPDTVDECEDVDECAGSNNCDIRKSTCENTGGSYGCLCDSGYKNDLVNPLLCIDVDECSDGLDTCNSTSSWCINSEGSFVCQCRDGFYQGSSNKICLPLKCVSLSAPLASTLEPDRCTQANANSFGDKCSLKCDDGYTKSNVGNGYVTCGLGGIWDGSLGSCEPVKCPKLTADQNGGLWPDTCATTGAEYPQWCSYTCNNGYTISGQSRRNCQVDGTWDGIPPTCTKIVVLPSITCPGNIIEDLDTGKSTADVSGVWKEPTSNVAQITVQPPEITAAYQFPVGSTKVEWTATNSAGSASCAIYVKISDTEAPTVVSCPVDIYNKSSVKPVVTWAEPIFSDNVNVTSVEKTYSSGEVFEFGTTNVKYDAKDAAGNRVSCRFEVTIERPLCTFPDPPDDGNSSCRKVGNSAFCSLLCPDGSHPYNASTTFWLCNNDGTWSPSDEFPDCVVASLKNDTPCEEGRTEVYIASFRGSYLYCAKCPKGTYALHGKCNPCPAGTYNSLQGQTKCTDCPAGTASLEGTKEIADCLQPCPAGRYSSNGLGPNCHVCPSDTFQNKPMQTKCEPCPNGTYTISLGTQSQDGCGVKPSITSIKPPFSSIDEGESVVFFCYATGIPTPRYQWQFTEDIPPEFLGKMSQAALNDSSGNVIGTRLTITDATVRNTGSYECMANNTHGHDLQLAQMYVAPVIDVGSGA